jgi:hypothetical protein
VHVVAKIGDALAAAGIEQIVLEAAPFVPGLRLRAGADLAAARGVLGGSVPGGSSEME